MTSKLLQRHKDYIEAVRASGGKVLVLTTPCCAKSLDVEAAPKGDTWDSLTTCPYCGDMFMKIVTHTTTEARR